MFSLLLVIFMLFVYVIIHSYVLYPMYMVLMGTKKEEKEKFTLTDELPAVAILMAAYNEEKVIGEKIESVFKTTYPVSKITFYIGSDASTDRTDPIIREKIQ